MWDNPVICGKLSCPPPRIHIRCQSVIACIHLHGQKRGMAEEKWGLSTSRTGIPLQRHKTVHLRHLTECFPKSLHEARPQQSHEKKKKTKRKASIPPTAQRMLTTGSLQDGYTRFQTRWLFCCCHSGKFLPTSAEEMWCRLTTRIFTFAPFIVPDSLLQMVQQFKCLPTTHTRANAPTVRSSWFLSPKARSRYKQPLW